MIVGYDIDRVTSLGRHTGHALGDLAGIVSDDPAAAPALAAAGRLRAVLATRLAPSIAALCTSDPLGAASAAYRDWLRSTVRTPYGGRSDDELFSELDRLELELPYDDDGRPDLDDPFWNDFDVLAIELAVRAELDDNFATELADRSADIVLIPIAVHFARFAPALVASMLRNVARTPSAVDDLRSRYQAYGADGLLDVLADVPFVALDVLATDDGHELLKELMEWPFIDSDLVAELVDAAMTAPFTDPTRLDDAFTVIQHLVALANRRPHETGFPTGVSPTLAKIVVQYLPFFVTSLDGHSDVHLKDFDFRDVGIRLGSYEEVIDLIGALLRDPNSLDIVLASVPTMALIGAGDHGPLGITPDDVANLVETINRAALNEQIEEQIRAARAERSAELTVETVFAALQLVTTVTGPIKLGAVELPLGVLKRGTLALVKWAIDATDLGLDDVAGLTFLLVVFGLVVGVLRSRDADSDDEDHCDAFAIVEEIEQRSSTGATIVELEGLIDDLARVARPLDDDGVLDVIDDVRVRPPDVDIIDAADLDD